MGHYVYKFVLNGETLYIGKNDTDLVSRVYSHGHSGDNVKAYGWDELKMADVYYIELANKYMSEVVESEMIRRYKPKYNKAKTKMWDGLPFAEPEWKLLVPEEPDRQSTGDAYLHAPYTYSKKQQLKNKFCDVFDELRDMTPIIAFLQNNIGRLPPEGKIRLWSRRKSLSIHYGINGFLTRSTCGRDIEPITNESHYFCDIELCENWKDNLICANDYLQAKRNFSEQIFNTLKEHYPDALNKPNRKSISEFYDKLDFYLSGAGFTEPAREIFIGKPSKEQIRKRY